MNIGQMFLMGFTGTTVTDNSWLKIALQENQLGGVILFDRNLDGSVRNFKSPQQLSELTTQLQEMATGYLLVAVDQEGGQVCRLREEDGFPSSISAEVLGKGDPDESTGPAATKLAKNLADHGINLNLAPVVDLDLNPDNPIISKYGRSFGSTVTQVVLHSYEFVEAHHKAGIACCLKHFPGHGSAGEDSHLGMVDVSSSWQARELDPYKKMVAAGFNDSVMTAHVVNSWLDNSKMPATMSPTILQSVLRKEVGFEGVIISDDLQMKAISDHFSYRDAVQKAVLAGVDLLIVGNLLDNQNEALDEGVSAIQELLDNGSLQPDHIKASLARIEELKQKIQTQVPD